jgi:Bacteriophage HK97-gp10, putative tail-component
MANEDFARELKAEIEKAVPVQSEKELTAELRKFGAEVIETAKSVSPYDPEDHNIQHYRDSFKFRIRNLRGKLPSGRITNTDALATIVEDGSYERPQGGWSEAHHVFAITASRYGGTTDHNGSDSDDELF